MVDYFYQYIDSPQQIFIIFYIFDFLITMVQFRIIDKIWTKKKHVQEYEVTIIMMVIFFNPLQLSSPSAQNLGVVKDLFCYFSIDQYLKP
jgi:phage-related holin